jgi:hypothetical protein
MTTFHLRGFVALCDIKIWTQVHNQCDVFGKQSLQLPFVLSDDEGRVSMMFEIKSILVQILYAPYLKEERLKTAALFRLFLFRLCFQFCQSQ